MLLDHGVFGDTSSPDALKLALREAFREFSSWCKANKVTCSHRKFTIGGIALDGYGDFLSSKGHNSRVLCEWLRHSLNLHPTPDPRHNLTMACLKLV